MCLFSSCVIISFFCLFFCDYSCLNFVELLKLKKKYVLETKNFSLNDYNNK